MKPSIHLLASLGLVSTAAFAGTVVSDTVSPAAAPIASADGFAQARRPISNPTLFDLALPGTNAHPIFMHHSLPDRLNVAPSGSVPVGGDVEIYALQFEVALNERLSIVATKDGYVDFNPDRTLSSESGFGNLAAGAKYAFYLDPASRTAVSGTATLELPTGDSDVFQGEGDGAINLILNGLQLVNDWQFAGAAGFQVPFSDEQSTTSFLSAHASYDLCQYFIPLVELNWFYVVDSGNGTGNFPSQAGGAVPNLVRSEGGDYFNLGGVNSSDNRDLVTAAIGFRSRLTDTVDVGAAYEIPLTEEEDSLMKERVTLDLNWKF